MTVEASVDSDFLEVTEPYRLDPDLALQDRHQHLPDGARIQTAPRLLTRPPSSGRANRFGWRSSRHCSIFQSVSVRSSSSEMSCSGGRMKSPKRSACPPRPSTVCCNVPAHSSKRQRRSEIRFPNRTTQHSANSCRSGSRHSSPTTSTRSSSCSPTRRSGRCRRSPVGTRVPKSSAA